MFECFYTKAKKRSELNKSITRAKSELDERERLYLTSLKDVIDAEQSYNEVDSSDKIKKKKSGIIYKQKVKEHKFKEDLFNASTDNYNRLLEQKNTLEKMEIMKDYHKRTTVMASTVKSYQVSKMVDIIHENNGKLQDAKEDMEDAMKMDDDEEEDIMLDVELPNPPKKKPVASIPNQVPNRSVYENLV